MPQTNAYTRGVKYIKIAKLDSGSVDQSIELQSLTDIRIKFSDVPNVTQYNVGAINEYPTYYLYTIVPTDVTSSVDQEILNYKVSGSSSTLTGTTQTNTNVSRISNYTTQLGTNTLGYFTASSGIYTLGNTPNTILSWTSSLNINYTDPGGLGASAFFIFGQLDNNGNFIEPYTQYNLSLPGGSGNISRTFSSSYTPVENQTYGWGLWQQNIVRISTFTNQFLITQSVSPQSSTYDITVLEPYVGENFYNSDCNVLQNNADVNVISPFYMDVDFTNSPIVAQNQSSILNGTAARAQVQSWNYSYFSNISGRYLGKQQNAIAINVYTSASQFTTPSVNGFTGSWPGDSTSPSIPVPGNIVIQSLDSCIYEVNWGGGGYPENANGGGINMGNIYLVGETKDDVAIIKPGTDIYYDLLAKIFPSGSTAYQYQYSNTSGLPNLLNITYPALGLPGASYYVASNYVNPSIYYPGSGVTQYWGILYPTGSATSGLVGVPYIDLGDVQSTNTYLAEINGSGYLQQSTNNIDNTTLLNTIFSGGSYSGATYITYPKDRWFLSFYSGSGLTSSLSTGLPKTTDGTPLEQYGYPFEINYLYSPPGNNYLILKNISTNNVKYWFETGSTYHSGAPVNIGSSGSKSYTGMLITKADTPTNGLTIYGVPSLNFAGTGQGYILSQYPKKVITENIDYITKTYGNNPN
jgi:hypothetical protein